ncbi:hypothetical protein [Jannaschia sp. R86511]|uniref:hypothetical protein n=1 Tax=Jannaschia sp. R86511 TaxID=3093853 RepID=UPI0036D2FA64
MTRSSRAAVGAVAVLVLVLVAAVSGLVALVGSAQLRDDTASTGFEDPGTDLFPDPVTVRAEVLDVDGVPADGWLSVDVAFETEDGGREVATVDLGEQEADAARPQVGDTIEVVHERSDPSWVLRADDPMLTGATVDEGIEPDPQASRAAAQALVDRTRALSLGSLGLALLLVLLTVVAVRRAPASPGWVAPPAPRTERQQSGESPASPR